ncbi:MAG: MarR family transcriptional regulator [Candidatus Kapabacteria bacterium]|nr:MarR family transcriptional regulator [Candidatus Kapabacteria bacterium]
MSEHLKRRLKQSKFTSPYQEAILGVMVCADRLTREMDITCETHGITTAQYNVLRILRGVHPGGHPRCEIIQRMIHVAPDVTRLIDRLEKLSLVKRVKSAEDLRLSLTVISPKGLELLNAMQSEVDALEVSFSSLISEKEAVVLAEICDKVTSHYQADAR